jgi:tRNA G18 (ribose-2'-O)-methylase SpoU
MIVIAHNIRSLHNVGAIFRSAAAFGIEKLYLTGFTACPPRKEIAKVALGAETLVSWEYSEDVANIIQELHADGYMVYALETTLGAAPLSTVANAKCALVLGNEVEGIDSATLALCDAAVEIPMAKKRSLNVSVAAGIAMYAGSREKGAGPDSAVL